MQNLNSQIKKKKPKLPRLIFVKKGLRFISKTWKSFCQKYVQKQELRKPTAYDDYCATRAKKGISQFPYPK